MMRNSPPPSDRPISGQNREEGQVRLSSDEDISAIVGALTDASARAIVAAIDDEPLSAHELSARCDLSLSTTYRKVNELSQLGLLEEEVRLGMDGKHISVYQCPYETISVATTETGFELQLRPADD